MLVPQPANALEFRRSDNIVTIAASETINDTLVIAAETVVIEGTIKGDLIAVGERVIFSGSVGGNLIAFAEAVTIRGQVDGSTLGAGSSLELSDAVVNGDFWGAGAVVSISRGSRIGGNATLATDMAIIAGEVTRDLFAFAENTQWLLLGD